MTEIDDPWHSRPIDVHRWADHPGVAEVVGPLWDAHFSDFDASGRSGPKPKTSFKQQFRALILDLYVAWKTDPELSIGVPMSANGWNTHSRYNAIGLSKKMIPIIDRAHRAGLIDRAPGSYSGPYGLGNRNTRIRAAELLREVFGQVTFEREDIGRHPEQECVILKDGEQQLEYEDTDETRAMRERLTAYNALLRATFIDIPTLDEPFIERTVATGPDEGKVERVAIADDQKFVRRIFSRGRWDLNGRFYGPWWQQVGTEWRAQIFINDVPTVEIDFKGLHVNLLSLEQGVLLEGDPHTLPPSAMPGVPATLQRTIIKTLVLKAINAPDKASAFKSFRQDWPTGHMAKGLTNRQLEGLIDVFLEQHPYLGGKVCADHGIRLMYVDSCITDHVLTAATHESLPFLGIHDSFIVPYDRVLRLKELMRDASTRITGADLPVEATHPGLDEMEPEYALDYAQWRQTPRSAGYLRRLAAHEERHGLLGAAA